MERKRFLGRELTMLMELRWTKSFPLVEKSLAFLFAALVQAQVA
jgi:hypothetical protein